MFRIFSETSKFKYRTVKDMKDPTIPTIALVLSFIVLGAGQFYNGQVLKGAFQFALASIGSIMLLHGVAAEIHRSRYESNERALLGWFILTSSWVWSFIDAPLAAKIMNKKK